LNLVLRFWVLAIRIGNGNGRKNLIKEYYLLTKPGIIYSNVFTAIGGFFLAEKGRFDAELFLSMVFGLGFVIASACVINNYIDRRIDSKMTRTKKRALVTKTIPSKHAIVFAVILGILGFSFLLFYTNALSAFIAFVGFFFYVVMYSIWKRRSVYGTLVGSVSGAVPPVVGYCAVVGQIDAAAILLFIILVFWQMPHFYAIAIFRKEEYAAAAIPVLPVKSGIRQTKIQMLIYIFAFVFAASLLSVLHYTGYVYRAVIIALGIFWIGYGIQGMRTTDEIKWARKMFFISLIVIVAFSMLLVINNFIM
jgi:heme o synthase